MAHEYIYLLHSEVTEGYKIGRTANISQRLKALKRSRTIGCSDSSIKQIAVWEVTDSYTLERELHNLLGNYRRQGEWFALDALGLQRLHGRMSTFEKHLINYL
jgi:T5orf172 domain